MPDTRSRRLRTWWYRAIGVRPTSPATARMVIASGPDRSAIRRPASRTWRRVVRSVGATGAPFEMGCNGSTAYGYLRRRPSHRIGWPHALPTTLPPTLPDRTGRRPAALPLAGARLAALTTAASEASRMLESMPTPHQVDPSAPSAST